MQILAFKRCMFDHFVGFALKGLKRSQKIIPREFSRDIPMTLLVK